MKKMKEYDNGLEKILYVYEGKEFSSKNELINYRNKEYNKELYRYLRSGLYCIIGLMVSLPILYYGNKIVKFCTTIGITTLWTVLLTRGKKNLDYKLKELNKDIGLIKDDNFSQLSKYIKVIKNRRWEFYGFKKLSKKNK